MHTDAPGYHATTDAHLKRLRRIEGQVRGVNKIRRDLDNKANGLSPANLSRA